MDGRPHIDVLEDEETLAQRAKDLFVSVASEAMASRGIFHVAIPGGRTPKRFFELLTEDPKAVDWSRVRVFWTDERYVPPDHPDSNYRLALDAFLACVPIPESNIYRIPTDLVTAGDAARSYEQTLRTVFQVQGDEVPSFDLVILGMGRDGHTASLFPGSAGVREDRALACTVSRPEGPSRISLTPPVLRAAGRILVLVSGPDKAATLSGVLLGNPDPPRYPIHVLWPVLDRVTWLVERRAARGLRPGLRSERGWVRE